MPLQSQQHSASTAHIASAASMSLLVFLAGCSSSTIPSSSGLSTGAARKAVVPKSVLGSNTDRGRLTTLAAGRPSGADTPSGEAWDYGGSPLPLDAFRESPAQGYLIGQATNALVNKCVAQLGVSPFLQLQPPRTPSSQFTFRYSNAPSLNLARKYGYHRSWLPSGRPHAPVPRYTGQQNLVLYGNRAGTVSTSSPPQMINHKLIPTGGCYGQAVRAIGLIQNEGPERLPENLQFAAWDMMLKDPVAVHAQADWSACLKTGGYSESDPQKAGNRFAKDPVASMAEIAEAIADAKCEATTDLVARMQRAEVRAQRTVATANAAALETTHAYLAKIVRRASQILAAGTN